MENPSATKKLALLERRRERGAPIRPAGPGPQPVALVQEGVWLQQLLEPEAPDYNVTFALRFEGRVDVRALAAAVAGIESRHEPLRTVFREQAGRAVQVVLEPRRAWLEEIDARGFTAEGVRARLVALADTPFDLERDRPFRPELLRTADDAWLLFVAVHHLVWDFTSTAIFLRELGALYRAETGEGGPTLEPLPIRYADYAVHARTCFEPVRARQRAYWTAQLAGAPPSPMLPGGTQGGPAARSTGSAGHGFTIQPELADRLRAFARAKGVSLFVALMAAFDAALHVVTGDEDIVVAVPVDDRSILGTRKLIGFFANTLVMRANVDRTTSFASVAEAVDAVVQDAFLHAELPVSELAPLLKSAARGAEASLLPRVSFSYSIDGAATEVDFGGVQVDVDYGPTPSERRRELFDLALRVRDRGERGLGATLLYRPEVYDEAVVRRFAERFLSLLDAATGAPDVALGALTIMPDDERRRVVEAWNATDAAYPDACAHQLFEASADASPSAVAVVMGDERATYADVERRANQLAHRLRALGVRPGGRVGLSVRRSVDAMVAVLGILKAGAAYVPIDPSYPKDRIALMVEDARPTALVTEHALIAELALDPKVPTVCVDRDAERLAREPSTRLDLPLPSASPLYVIYTSGSTGRPKGVVLPHRVLVNLVAWQDHSRVHRGGATLQFTPLSFDVSAQEIFSTWHAGGSVHIVSDDVRRDPRLLLDVLEAERIERLFLPFVALKNLALSVASGERGLPRSLRSVVTAGEQLQATPEVVALFEGLPECLLHNHYGPSETHVATAHTLDAPASAWPRLPSIGRPIANTQVYILDPDLAPVPTGVRGEIYIGGACVADGYFERPELTAERFVPDPFRAHGRMYRTGDLGRFFDDGSIEYLGRADGQVKVRGFRVEPGEIEAVLAGCLGVKAVAVVPRKNARGDALLAAYVVVDAQGGVQAADLRDALAGRLPEYMVPSAFVLLDALPLTPSGKVDRRALPAPDFTASATEYVAPKSAIEETIAGVFAEVLGASRVGANDDFFDLGGHSLLATQAVSRLRALLAVDVPVRAMFDAPTVARLAEHLGGALATRTAPSPITPVDRSRPLRASFAQERIWFASQFEPDGATYNLPFGLRLRGRLDRTALARSLDALLARHEALRTVLRDTEGGLEQVVLPATAMPLAVVEPTALAEGEGRERALSELVAREVHRPFDLARGPLVRATLFALGPDEHFLLVAAHHIALDGWSIVRFSNELGALYDAIASGRGSSLPELPVQYADFAAWQRAWLASGVMADQLAYWRDALAELPPSLELPTDRPRPPVRASAGATTFFTLDAEVAGGLRDLARREGTTLFVVLLAAYATLLARWSGQNDLVVGSPIAARTRPEIEPLVGMFVNTLPIRADLTGGPSFREVVRRLKERALGAFAHQDVPFEHLVDDLSPPRDTSRTPIFQVSFILQNAFEDVLRLGAVEARRDDPALAVSKFDLTLGVRDRGADLAAAIEYDTALFDASTIERFAQQLEVVARAGVASPDVRVTALPVLPDAERRRLVHELGAGPTSPDEPRCIHDLFEEQVGRTPDALAVSDEHGALTYAALHGRAGAIAEALVDGGVRRGDVVALHLPRSCEAVASMLAVLAVGAAYIALDTKQPPARLQQLVLDSGARVVVHRDAADAPAFGVPVVTLDGVGRTGTGLPRRAVSPDDRAYVIYTSGSTGKPKGVCIAHATLGRMARSEARARAAGAELRYAQYANLAFDSHVWEIWPAILSGASLHFIPDAIRLDLPALLQWLAETRIGWCFLPTPVAEPCLRMEWPASSSLETLAVAGDMLHGVPPGPFGFRLENHYGPSECTCETTAAVIEPGDPRPTIGRPIPGVRVYVLDGELEPVPMGVFGELTIGGTQVGQGYLGRPDLTAERFVPDPFAKQRGARMYRTGDLARFRADGTLEFAGRADHQVKIRGNRIELGEVEAAIVASGAVTETVVLAREDVPGDKRLVAYVVLRDATSGALDGLRASLRSTLPEYMVPTAFVTLERLPLNPNGKVDRKALPVPAPQEDGASYVAPRTDAEAALASVFAEVLRVPRVGVHDDFFRLGGDSILTIRVVALARRAGLHLTVKEMYGAPSVADLAPLARRAASVQAEQGPVTGPLPLTPAIRWLLDAQPDAPDHFNQAVLLELPRAISPETVSAGLERLAQHHDALRLRVRRVDGAWTVSLAEPGGAFPLTTHDVASLDERQRAQLVTERCSEAQGALDLARGPIARAILFEDGPRAPRLFLVVHHVAVDGVSWRILLEDLGALLVPGCEPATVREAKLPEKTTSFRAWAERLAAHARTPEVAGELEFWTAQPWREATAVGAATSPNDRLVEVTRRLDRETTAGLLTRGLAPYRLDADEALIAAFVRALGTTLGGGVHALHVESHGRDLPFDDLDVSRTVGWFTVLYPVLVNAPPGASLRDTVVSVKEQLRAFSARGASFGLLRHLSTTEHQERLAALPAPSVIFNYLGQFGGDLRASELPTGPTASPAARATHAVAVNALVRQGELVVQLTHDPAVVSAERAKQLVEAFLGEVRALVEHASAPDAGALTPSDVTMPITQAELDRLATLAGTAPSRVEDAYPLLPIQQGFLYHHLRDEGDDPYTSQLVLTLDEALDAAALERAFQALVDRHAVLRTSFVWEDVLDPVQVVHKGARFELERLDWRDVPGEDLRDRLATWMEANRRRGFDLRVAPLVRASLIRATDGFRLVWASHHIVSDGWSFGLLMSELVSLYAHHAGGAPLRLEPPPRFGTFVEWALRQPKQASEAFFRETLRGVDEPTLLEPAGETSSSFAQTVSQLSEEATAAISDLARRLRVTPSTIVHAAWGVVLARHTGRRDVLFGSTASGRAAPVAKSDMMVGVFINAVPVRVRLADTPVATWLEELQAHFNELRSHEHVPLNEVQSWSEIASGQPFFESMLTFENQHLDEGARDVTTLGIRGYQVLERTHYPLSLLVVPGKRLKLSLHYDADRFDGTAVQHATRHLEEVLRQITRDPSQRADRLHILSDEDRVQLAAFRASGARPEPDARCVHDHFHEHAARAPGEPALADEELALTYGEAEGRALALAERLVALGVRRGDVVALVLPRSALAVVAMLGVHDAGATYLALDPEQPEARLRQLVQDSRARAAIVLDAAASPELGAPRVDFASLPKAPSTGFRRRRVTPHDRAYLVYTSGSTGVPKGVSISHATLATMARVEAENRGAGPGRRFSQYANLAFDAHVSEIWPALVAGGSVHVIPDSVRLDVDALVAWLADTRIAWSFLPTPVAEQCLRLPWPPCELRRLTVAGDALHAVPHGAFPFELQNHYGPSECTCVATGAIITPGDEHPSIGLPVQGVTVYVLDRSFEPTAPGVLGELCIGGVLVGQGYHERPALTAEKYLPDPFSDVPGARLYRTGDLARFREDGSIEFAGRIDHQVKIRGNRIELGEVEAAIAALPGVAETIVLAREDTPGDKRLAAYVVAQPGATFDVDGARAALGTRLPDYMVPSAFVVLPALPLTPNGKLDRKALPKPEYTVTTAAYVAPRDATEETLARLWEEILKVPRVGIHDDFFALGGDSILLMRLVARAKLAGIALAVKDVWNAPTIAQLSSKVGSGRAVTANQGAVHGPFELLPVYRWYLESEPRDRHHFNQSQLLRLPESIAEDTLRAALVRLATHHDALRLRFEGSGAETRATFSGEAATSFPLEVHDASDPARRTAVIEACCAAAQGSLDLAAGPLARAHYFRCGDEPDRLFLVVHHFAVDGVSFRILLEDLFTLTSKGADAPLPPKTTSLKEWGERLARFARSEEALEDVDFWLSRRWADAPEIRPTERTFHALEHVRGQLDRATTTALLTRALVPYRLRIDDALLTAFAVAMAKLGGTSSVAFTLEKHGREMPFDDVDPTRTVGWFTATFPVLLALSDPGDVAESMLDVRRQLRAFADRGPTFGLLRYLADDPRARRLKGEVPMPAVSFNYLGQQTTGGYASGAERTGSEIAPGARAPGTLMVNALVVDGELRLELAFDPDVIGAQAGAQLREDFFGTLRALVAHAERAPTSAFPLSWPMRTVWGYEQESPDTSSWTESYSVVFRDVDVDRLRRCFEWILDRHEILRTSFEVVRGEPRIRVRPRSPSQVEEVDLRDAADPPGEARTLFDARAARRIDLLREPACTVTLARLAERDVAVLLRSHHIVLDLNGRNVVIRELKQAYYALEHGKEAPAAPAVQYRDFAAWDDAQYPPRDATSTSLRYWRNKLAGAKGLPLPRSPKPGGAKTALVAPVTTSERLDAQITALARELGTTAYTIFLAVMNAHLVHVCGTTDVTTLMATSASRERLPGLVDLAGHFIAQLPIRLDASDSPTFSDLVRRTAETVQDALAHQDAPSNLIFGVDSPIGSPLGRVVVNFAAIGGPGGGVEGPPAADLRIEVLPLPTGVDRKAPLAWVIRSIGPRFYSDFIGGADWFDEATLARWAAAIVAILERVTAAPETRLGALAAPET